MAKIKCMSNARAPVGCMPDFFSLLPNLERYTGVVLRVMGRLGIEFASTDDVGKELRELFERAVGAGITHGRVTAVMPKGFPFMRAVKALDAEGLLPEGVSSVYIENELEGETVGALIRSGALDGKGEKGEVEFRILPCAEGWGERRFRGSRLEPVGMFYDMSRIGQEKAFQEYSEALPDHLDVRFAEPLEVVIATMCSREVGVEPKSDDVPFNWGWYRTMVPVPGHGDRWLCVSSVGGQLRLVWEDWSGAYARYSVVCSVGVK